MSRKRGTRSRRRVLPSKALVIAGLAIFIAVDIVLVALALGWGRDEPRTTESSSLTQTTAPVKEWEEGAGDAEPSPDADAETPQTAPRLISVVNDTVAWRSEGGPCDERGAVELTIDGGETWGAAYPSADGLGRPLWVSGGDYRSVQSAIASGADCDPEGVRTVDSGASWTQEGQVMANSVIVDPRDSSLLLSGGEIVEGPCDDMNQVAANGGVAAAICGDGSLWSLAPAGAEWTRAGVEGAVAISGSEDRFIAASDSPECHGLGLFEFAAASLEPLACLPVGAQDPTAIGLSGHALWVWAGDQVLISTDHGRSFN